MIRTVRRLAAPALLATLALGTAACGGDDADSGSGTPPSTSDASASGSPTGDASAEPTASESSGSTGSTGSSGASQAAAPATGPALTQTVVSVNAPDGWELGRAPASFSSTADGPGRGDTLLLIDNVSLAGPGATIDDLYDSFVDLNKGDKKLTWERLPDLDLQGTPASYVHTSSKGDDEDQWVVTAVRGERVVSLTFNLNPRVLEQDPQVIDSVLASLRWLD